MASVVGVVALPACIFRTLRLSCEVPRAQRGSQKQKCTQQKAVDSREGHPARQAVATEAAEEGLCAGRYVRGEQPAKKVPERPVKELWLKTCSNKSRMRVSSSATKSR